MQRMSSLLWAGETHHWQNKNTNQTQYSALDRGLECKGQGTARWQRRSGMPSQTAQEKVTKWGGLCQAMSKQQYGHHNNPLSHKDIHKHK